MGGGLRPRPFVASFLLALNKAHALALNTAHVLRLNKADVLALNKAHGGLRPPAPLCGFLFTGSEHWAYLCGLPRRFLPLTVLTVEIPLGAAQGLLYR